MRLLAALALILACVQRPGHAGEIIRFEAGAQARSDVVLAHVPVKALVAEFLDPGDTGAGKSVGYLVWREILTAISDQAGAGVILARAPGERRLTDLLESAYHDAAVNIAREQNASMAVWGAVSADGDALYVSAYLSILPEAAGLQLKLRLAGQPPLPPGLEASIARSNFNFPPVETTRAELFERRVVTRAQSTVRAGADGAAAALERVPKGKALDAVDMDKGWFKVRLASGRFGYLDNSVVDVPPRAVEASGVQATLSRGPAGARVKRVKLDGRYAVLDMRYVSGKGLWYQLDADGTRGWVPASLVRARFSLPIVHFVAGLYRYQFKRYEDARREFAQYVSAPQSAADNPSLAAAYQLFGASVLLGKSTVFEADPATVELFSKAVNATPYDPNAYSLRALSTLALRREADPALADLEQALKLDPADVTAARITGVLHEQVTRPEGNAVKHMLQDSGRPALQLRLKDLAKRYPAPLP
jgi:tetratricopeptide (TPR) repeat protein